MNYLSKLLGVFCLLSVHSLNAQFSADLEGAYIFSVPYNVVRIPSEGGTEFDIANDLKPNTTFVFRTRLNLTIKKRHVISALAAPLTIKSIGSVSKPIIYSDKTFEAGKPLEAVYKFNSYRLTYRYLFVQKNHLNIGAGLTAKVREANITLRNENVSADFPDLGIVPLINFYISWLPGKRWMVLIDGDALVSKQGRAEDVFAGVAYRFTERFAVKGGYRVLEGGADVKRNYNFSFINYACAGILFNY